MAVTKIANHIYLMASGQRTSANCACRPTRPVARPCRASLAQAAALSTLRVTTIEDDVTIGIAAGQGHFELNV